MMVGRVPKLFSYSSSWRLCEQFASILSSLNYNILLSFFLFSLQLNLLVRFWAFYLWHHSCFKKFQLRRKIHILWVGLFFSSHSLRKFTYLVGIFTSRSLYINWIIFGDLFELLKAVQTELRTSVLTYFRNNSPNQSKTGLF